MAAESSKAFKERISCLRESLIGCSGNGTGVLSLVLRIFEAFFEREDDVRWEESQW